MNDIIAILNEIRNTSSSNAKKSILEQNSDNELLKKVLFYTYNPFFMYGISENKLKSMNFEQKSADFTDKIAVLQHTELFTMLDKLANNNINDNLRQEFVDYVSQFQSNEIELIKNIVIKDLRIGINVSTINKVWKNLVPVFNVQLANKYEPTKLKQGQRIFLTEKLDGIRCIAFKEGNNISLFSRQGKRITGLRDVETALQKVPGDFVFDGELLLITDKQIESGELYRQTVKVVNSKQDIKLGVCYHIFDIITSTDFVKGISESEYSTRRTVLDALDKGVFTNDESVRIVPLLYKGDNHLMISTVLEDVEKQGKEGIMINTDDFYLCKRCNSLLKVKSMQTCDVKVLNVVEGVGKNKGKLGAIIVEFEHNDKKYTCSVGSGFSEQERCMYWNDTHLLLNKIVEIRYFEVSKNEQNEHSLRFPVWIGRVRHDKTEISMN